MMGGGKFMVTKVALRLLALVLVLALHGAPALAEEGEPPPPQDFGRNGLYLGAQAVYGLENWDIFKAHATDAYGFSFLVGYRMSEWVGAEIDVEYLNSFTRHLSENIGAVNTTIKAKVYPLSGRYQPFISLGIGILATTGDQLRDFGFSNEADWATKTGLGMEIYATRNWVVNAEATYVWTLGDVKGMDYASFGLGFLYRF
jgi:hypothetical protein